MPCPHCKITIIKQSENESAVSKGMIADFAIHDKGDGNPHAHVLLTMRAMTKRADSSPSAARYTS